MDLSRIKYLFNRYETGTATDEEKAELLDWFDDHRNKEVVNEYFMQEMQEERAFNALDKEEWRPVIEKILAGQKGKLVNIPGRRRILSRITAAAAILLVLAGGYWFFVHRPEEGKSMNKTAVNVYHDVKAPQVNRAMITLANGQRVFLDSAANGLLARQSSLTIVKTGDGQISYQQLTNGQPAYGAGTQPRFKSRELIYNTLSNPRGSKVVDMILSDGSHVWLNSGSSITYPVAFTGIDRKVKVDGEAYFEVAHDPSKPFIVSNGDVDVQVLGTHFNVNAYSDETAIEVTLLQGEVRVSKGNLSALLKPKQQARISHEISVTNDIDTDEVMAWKDGIFLLDNTDLPTIMKQISRWYDVDIVFEGTITNKRFGGGVSRNSPLSEVLKLLEANGLHFELEGKTLKVK